MRLGVSILSVMALCAASCSRSPVHEDGAINDTAPGLAASVQQCGLDMDKVTFVETELEQFLTFERHSLLSESEFECLAQVLVTADYGLRTRDEAFSQEYTRAWNGQHALYVRKLANEWIAENKPSVVVPELDGGEDDLPDFVAEVEQLCGAPKGTALVTGPLEVYLPWPQEPANEADCLFAVLSASNLHEHGIGVSWGGVP